MIDRALAIILTLSVFSSACAPPAPAVPTPLATAEPTSATLPFVASGRAGPDPEATPRAPIDLTRLPRWSRGDVVSLMALGIDRRGSEIPRSDTIILATIDMAAREARAISIPRDLLVDIPGLGPERINAAFAMGERERPGNGPQHARQAVERNFQIRIPHWIVIDFQCFRTAVDAIGGMFLDIPSGIIDESYPDESYGTMMVAFDPGFQWLNGERALQYARTRHGDSDFGRMRRQQQVLSALRTQLITIQHLPVLPSVLDGCRGFSSDLPLIDLVNLAFSARTIPESSIKLTVIDERMARPSVSPSGASVLIPSWEIIRPLVREAMPATGGIRL
ncbi:MAG: LCP family protein [Chloroflexota bacterium]